MGRKPAEMTKVIGIARFTLECVLTVALAVVAGNAVWLIAGGGGALATSGETPSAQQTGFSSEAPPRRDLMILVNNNPFLADELINEITSVDSDALNAPETGLNLKLRGVRANGDGAGVAFITLPDNRQVRAVVGDELLDDVRLEYVFADRVTLRTRGELETLYRRDENAVSVIRSVNDGSERPRAGRNETGTSDQDDDFGTVAEIGVEAEDLMRSMTMAIVRDDGARSGYRLMPRGEATLMLDAGFEPGDIIRSINSRPVSQIDTDDMQELILSASVVDFDIERGGESERVTVVFTGGVRP